jgi:hypothetical protein
MRHTLFLLLLLAACQSHPTLEPQQLVDVAEPTTKPARIGLIIVNDISKSGYLTADAATLTTFLYKYVYDGFVISALNIQSNSHRQQPWLSPVVIADTLSITSTNFLAADRQRKRNAVLKQAAVNQCQSVADEVSKRIFVPLTHERSDVQGGLQMAADIAKTYVERNMQPVIIILSDLLQDVEPGMEMLELVSFPPNSEIIVIGANPSVDLKKVFGSIKVRALVSFQHLNL